MTRLVLLEILISLSIQAGLIIALTGVAVRLGGRKVRGDQLWFCGHTAVLAMVLAAFTLPHLRLLVASPNLLDRWSSIFEWHSLSNSIVTIWAAGVAISLANLVFGTCRLHSELRSATAASDAMLAKLDGRLIGTKRIRVLISGTSKGPFCWQVHCPTMVLPAFILNWPTEMIDSVVRHELVHLRSQHPMQLFCQRIVECFFWFHPVVWLGSRAAIAHREFHCDMECISTEGDAVPYLRSLVRLAEIGAKLSSRLATGAAFVGTQSVVQQRAQRIADWNQAQPSQTRTSTSSGTFVLGIALMLCTLVAMAIWIPLNPLASRRSIWSPWPRVSANVLQTFGIAVTDYEIDGHRLRHHEHANQ